VQLLREQKRRSVGTGRDISKSFTLLSRKNSKRSGLRGSATDRHASSISWKDMTPWGQGNVLAINKKKGWGKGVMGTWGGNLRSKRELVVNEN